MAKAPIVDPFVCDTPEMEIDPATSRILKQRLKTAGEGRLVSAGQARERIKLWLSKSTITKKP
jgi:hypothetical protein